MFGIGRMQDIFLALRRIVDVFVLRLDLASERTDYLIFVVLSVVLSVVLTLFSIASSVVMGRVPCNVRDMVKGGLVFRALIRPFSFNNALSPYLMAYFSRPVFTTVFRHC